MKVSRDQVDENRRRILAVAGRLFRERGLDGVSVADVMKAAGLTHGAFYGYFASKDELFAATLADLMAAQRPTGGFDENLARYLSREHRDERAGGCPVAALAPEAPRASPDARAAFTRGVEAMAAKAGADRTAGLARVAAMVGALVLARAVDDAELSDDLLAATRAALGDATLDG